MRQIFRRSEIEALRPAEWPCANYPQYLAPDQAPYLSEIIEQAKAARYHKDDIASAWAGLLDNKSNNYCPEGEELDLVEALTVLFEPLSYYEVKRHYIVFVAALEK